MSLQRLLAPFLLLVGLAPINLLAQERHTPNTLAFQPGTEPPAAALSDIAWLEGHWQGEALGGISEEIWSPAFGGTMMGMYKLVRGDSVIFYELLTMAEESGSLVLKLKHFNADLTGWEEQDEVVRFPLVERSADRMFFDGMTFERIAPDTIRVFVAVHGQDGAMSEEPFLYHRVGQ